MKLLSPESAAQICSSTPGHILAPQPPLVIGHELSGRLAELPPGYTGEFSVGDPVTVNPLISCNRCTPCLTGQSHVCRQLRLTGIDTDGGFAEFTKVPLGQLVKLPAGMSLEHGAIVEPVAVAVHAIRRSAFKIGDIVLVIGGGPMGVLVALTAKCAGARRVIVIEPNDFRRNLICELGFEAKREVEHEMLMRVTNGDGFDIVYEVAGVQAAMDAAIKYCKIRGQVVNVSVFKKPADGGLAAAQLRGTGDDRDSRLYPGRLRRRSQSDRQAPGVRKGDHSSLPTAGYAEGNRSDEGGRRHLEGADLPSLEEAPFFGDARPAG